MVTWHAQAAQLLQAGAEGEKVEGMTALQLTGTAASNFFLQNKGW